ncbi:MAG: alpha/beta fold hydrolase [Clostridia bacterium]|nr:alpha/beta fold hydrolase [Clostridia bacterium]
MKSQPKKWNGKKGWIILASVILLLAASFFAYVSVYYRADEAALGFMNSDESVAVTATRYGWLFDGPSEDAALIFYPGGKVEEKAYAPLLHALAAQGLDACLVKMPFRLAVLHGNAAEEVLKTHGYTEWYIGGHSLGGAMAAMYAADHGSDFSGVILLAAYPSQKLPDTLTEIQLIGSEDRIINRDKVKQGQAYAPPNCVEYTIKGGNHAQFGSYGVQRGDGTAAISAEEQIQETVRVIMESLRAD